MSEIKTVLCFVIIVGLVSTISVSANINNTRNVTIQLEPYLEGIRCLSIFGPRYDQVSEQSFLFQIESYGGTYNRTAPLNPIIDSFDMYQDVDYLCDEVTISDFDLIWLPGQWGNYNNSLSYYPTAISLIIDAYNEGLVIVALNHGPQILATADIITGKNITGAPLIEDEIEAAGGNYISYNLGIQTDLPFVTCSGLDFDFLIYDVALALGLFIPPDTHNTFIASTSSAAIHLPSLLFILGVSLFAILFKKKRR